MNKDNKVFPIIEKHVVLEFCNQTKSLEDYQVGYLSKMLTAMIETLNVYPEFIVTDNPEKYKEEYQLIFNKSEEVRVVINSLFSHREYINHKNSIKLVSEVRKEVEKERREFINDLLDPNYIKSLTVIYHGPDGASYDSNIDLEDYPFIGGEDREKIKRLLYINGLVFNKLSYYLKDFNIIDRIEIMSMDKLFKFIKDKYPEYTLATGTLITDYIDTHPELNVYRINSLLTLTDEEYEYIGDDFDIPTIRKNYVIIHESIAPQLNKTLFFDSGLYTDEMYNHYLEKCKADKLVPSQTLRETRKIIDSLISTDISKLTFKELKLLDNRIRNNISHFGYKDDMLREKFLEVDNRLNDFNKYLKPIRKMIDTVVNHKEYYSEEQLIQANEINTLINSENVYIEDLWQFRFTKFERKTKVVPVRLYPEPSGDRYYSKEVIRKKNKRIVILSLISIALISTVIYLTL